MTRCSSKLSGISAGRLRCCACAELRMHPCMHVEGDNALFPGARWTWTCRGRAARRACRDSRRACSCSLTAPFASPTLAGGACASTTSRRDITPMAYHVHHKSHAESLRTEVLLGPVLCQAPPAIHATLLLLQAGIRALFGSELSSFAVPALVGICVRLVWMWQWWLHRWNTGSPWWCPTSACWRWAASHCCST